MLDKKYSANEKENKWLNYWKENGIYDLVFGNFYPSQIKEILDNPKKFEDISKIYKKQFNIQIKKVRGDKLNEKK